MPWAPEPFFMSVRIGATGPCRAPARTTQVVPTHLEVK